MIELQFINKVLEEQALTLARQNDVDLNHFKSYKNEYKYILDHYDKYGNVPDEATFLDKFEDFELIQIEESNRYLVEELKEQYLFRKMCKSIKKLTKLAEKDSWEAYTFLKQKIEEFNEIGTYYEGEDLVQDANKRLEEFKQRQKGMKTGIGTGIEELDRITNGWQEEDLVTIIARTSQGKTWLLLFFLVQAWKQGKKVLMFNGELPSSVIGYRFDTLYKNFSNTKLSRGDEEVEKDYKEYIEQLKNKDTPFTVITPNDINGKLTATKLESLLEKYSPDIVGIDQITLMKDERGARRKHTKYENISEDLNQMSQKYKLPIIAPHQANRNAEDGDDIESINDIEVPKIKEVFGSDGIAHNSRRILTFKKVDKMTKIVVKKNNYGQTGEILLLWDMDIGLLKPYLTKDQDGNVEVDKSTSELF